MDCPFFIGQRVVCIKKGAWKHTHGKPIWPGEWLPQHGDVLTIDDMRPHEDGVYLHFLDDPTPRHCFHHKHFRPVVDRPTDISIFTAMLKTKQLDLV